MKSGLILVDMDMVLADFHAGFERVWTKQFPEREIVKIERRRDFYLINDHDISYRSDIENIINAQSFSLTLEPIAGAVEGFTELLRNFPHVRICTTSLKNPFSHSEKWQWVQNTFGHKVANDMIICNDKTLVKAVYLIDDRPQIKGAVTPEWEHVIFTQPYNCDIAGVHFKWGDDLQEILDSYGV